MARSYDVIQSEIQKLQQEAEEALGQERNEAIARILAEMAKFDISADELSAAAAVPRKGAAGKRTIAPVTKAVSAPVSASDTSPAVALLQNAGIDFTRKLSTVAPPATPAKKAAPKAQRTGKAAPKKVAPRKVATKSTGKAKTAGNQ